MNNRAKLFLVLAAAGGGFALIAGSSKKAKAEPAPSPLPPLGEVPTSLPPEFVLPLPGETIPPRRPVDLRDDKEIEEDEDLQAIAPPFVPEPISNGPRPVPSLPAPPPGPPPVFQPPVFQPPVVPPELEDIPELLEQIPGLVPPPQRSPGIDIPTPPRPQPPLPSPPEDPDVTVLREDTAEVLGVMLPKERTKDWKRTEAVLKLWQEDRNRPVDGKFGPGDALVMAEETGLLPIIRFWPRRSLIETGAVEDYRAALLRLARSAEEPRKTQLRAAAEREHGQAFARNPEPIVPTISL